MAVTIATLQAVAELRGDMAQKLEGLAPSLRTTSALLAGRSRAVQYTSAAPSITPNGRSRRHSVTPLRGPHTR